jgi:hypothetical protein
MWSELINVLFIYSHVHTLFGSFLPSAPSPTLLSLPRFQAEPVLPLSLILLKRRHKHNEEDKAFLLVEIRIAIQIPSIAFMYKCVTTQVSYL